MELNSTQPPPTKPKWQKSKYVRKKPPPTPAQIDFGDVDNLAPVLQAIGLTSDLKPQLDPVLREYFTKLFEGGAKGDRKSVV